MADSKPLELAARAGLIAYGVVHLVIGLIALRSAWGGGEEAYLVLAVSTASLAMAGSSPEQVR